jgi:hypothetical protein
MISPPVNPHIAGGLHSGPFVLIAEPRINKNCGVWRMDREKVKKLVF